jgi:serine/threonine protein kinase
MTPSEFNARFDYDPDNDLLGEGGFGKIFKAWDNVRNEFIALKMSRVQPGMEEFSLLSEYERVRHLEHPNIARYMDCQRIKLPGLGTHDIALMKHYEYGNLSQLLGNHMLTTAQKHKLIEGLLEGIAYLHKLKPLIIHSDLKPSNILVVERRGFFIPLITDFGISRQAKADDKSYVTNLTGAGTYAYAAPEQWEAVELRPNADLWSFGILLIYIWFNGKKLPFRSDDVSIATESGRIEYMKRVIALDLIPDLKELPEEYRRMVEACLVVNPLARVKSAEDLHGKQTRPAEKVEETILQAKPKPLNPRLIPIEEKTQVMMVDLPEPPKPAIRPEKVDAEVPIAAKSRSKKVFLIAGSCILVATLAGTGLYYTTNPAGNAAAIIRDSVKIAAPKLLSDKKIENPGDIKPKPVEKAIVKKPVPPRTTPEKRPVNSGAVYHVVDQYPSFPGGQHAMNQWLAQNLTMPEAAERSFISAAVKLSFIVNADGSLQDIQLVKKIGYGCDEEALRLVHAMPRWKPGRTDGRAVRTSHALSIQFE